MKPLSPDTHPDIERILIEGYRKMPPWEKMQRVREMTLMVQELALSDIRRRHPDASDRQHQLRLASRWLDRDTMVKVFDWDPVEHGY